MVDLTPVETSKPVNIRDWDLDFGPLNDVIVNGVQDYLEYLLKEYPPAFRVPVIWSDSDGGRGPAVTDPLTIYIELPFHGDSDTVEYKFSIADVVSDLIETLDGSFSGDDFDLSKRAKFAAALREQADRLAKV